MNREALKQQLIRHEGIVPHAYRCTAGFWTIGVGRLIDKERGGGLSPDEIEYLLNNDIERVHYQLTKRIAFWDRLTSSQQQALCNMAFQLGVGGLLGFRKMLAALERGDKSTAEAEALDSRWARQTPNRAREVAAMLKR